MLPCSLSFERVKPVAWRDLEIIKPSRQVDVLQLPPCPLDHIRWKPSRFANRVQPLRMPIRERLDHVASVLCHVTRVKARDLPRDSAMAHLSAPSLPICGSNSRSPLGVAAVLAQNPLRWPKKAKKSPAPAFHVVSNRCSAGRWQRTDG